MLARRFFSFPNGFNVMSLSQEVIDVPRFLTWRFFLQFD
jgi:hypothetical protein